MINCNKVRVEFVFTQTDHSRIERYGRKIIKNIIDSVKIKNIN